MNGLKMMSDGDFRVIPVGFKGHTILMEIEKTDWDFSLSLYDTGGFIGTEGLGLKNYV